jgi:hypothetical protein
MSRMHDETHLIGRIGWLRAAVLGANDGIISTVSLILGVASAAVSQSEVLLAGVAGLVAGAMSMAAGEYLSVSSQSDTEGADLAREKRELADSPVLAQNCGNIEKAAISSSGPHILGWHGYDPARARLLLSFRFRSRASLELELVALRHQVIVLRRQRPHRLRLLSADRLLWVWLYRVRPQVLETLVLVKPATVVKWHRKGFRIYWRWRSRSPGRPKTSNEIRDLIRACFGPVSFGWLSSDFRAS